MKWLGAVLVVAIAMLQYRLWLSPGGMRELKRLETAVHEQQERNNELAERNQQLVAEVADLKSGLTAIEERARTALGMIARSETFYQVVPPPTHAGNAGAATRTAAAR
jgi:cell division protein FtsB